MAGREHILSLFLFSFSISIQDLHNLKEDVIVRGDGGTPLSEGEKARVSLAREAGFQLPSCPSSSAAPSGREHADPAHWVGLCEAGSCLFPWALGMNMELLDAIMIQRWDPGSVKCPLLTSLYIF